MKESTTARSFSLHARLVDWPVEKGDTAEVGVAIAVDTVTTVLVKTCVVGLDPLV
jgi:hypothetical protein